MTRPACLLVKSKKKKVNKLLCSAFMHPKLISEDAALATATQLIRHYCHLDVEWHRSVHCLVLGTNGSSSSNTILKKKNCGAFMFSLHSPSLKSFTAILSHKSLLCACIQKVRVCGPWWHSQSLAYEHVGCLLYDFNTAESVLMHRMARRTLLCKSWEKSCNDGTQLELHDCRFAGFRDAGCH